MTTNAIRQLQNVDKAIGAAQQVVRFNGRGSLSPEMASQGLDRAAEELFNAAQAACVSGQIVGAHALLTRARTEPVEPQELWRQLVDSVIEQLPRPDPTSRTTQPVTPQTSVGGTRAWSAPRLVSGRLLWTALAVGVGAMLLVVLALGFNRSSAPVSVGGGPTTARTTTDGSGGGAATGDLWAPLPDRYVTFEIKQADGSRLSGRVTVGKAQRNQGTCVFDSGDRALYYPTTVEVTVLSSLPAPITLEVVGFYEDGSKCWKDNRYILGKTNVPPNQTLRWKGWLATKDAITVEHPDGDPDRIKAAWTSVTGGGYNGSISVSGPLAMGCTHGRGDFGMPSKQLPGMSLEGDLPFTMMMAAQFSQTGPSPVTCQRL